MTQPHEQDSQFDRRAFDEHEISQKQQPKTIKSLKEDHLSYAIRN